MPKIWDDYDIRKAEYEKAKTITKEEFKQFFDNHVKDKPCAYLLIGNKRWLI
jgi:hypothetical protein